MPPGWSGGPWTGSQNCMFPQQTCQLSVPSAAQEVRCKRIWGCTAIIRMLRCVCCGGRRTEGSRARQFRTDVATTDFRRWRQTSSRTRPGSLARRESLVVFVIHQVSIVATFPSRFLPHWTSNIFVVLIRTLGRFTASFPICTPERALIIFIREKELF